jgi:hypothetical protein
MTILLISIVWFAALAALVLLLAKRPRRAAATSWERSPRLIQGARDSFTQAMEAMLASEPATAEDVRDRAQEDLYVRP